MDVPHTIERLDALEMPALYALETHWLKLDRFYKLYVGRNAIYAAYLCSQVYDDRSLEVGSGGFGPLLAMGRRQICKRLVRESVYDDSEIKAREFLEREPRNRVLLRQELPHAQVLWRFSLWTVSVVMHLRLSGDAVAKASFVLPAQQPLSVADALEALGVQSRFSIASMDDERVVVSR